MPSNALRLVNGIPRMQAISGSSLSIKDEGGSIASGVSILNFIGSNVVAADAGGGQVNVSVSAGGTPSIYDEASVIGGGGLTSGTPITLPAAGEYDSIDLEVYIGGMFLEDGIDYNYVGASPPRTQVTFVEDLPAGERVRFRVEGTAAAFIYDQTTVVGGGGISTGVDITLPASGEYLGDELEVYLNGDFMEPGIDYNYVGISPYTQIEMTFDLVEGDRLRFRMDQG